MIAIQAVRIPLPAKRQMCVKFRSRRFAAKMDRKLRQEDKFLVCSDFQNSFYQQGEIWIFPDIFLTDLTVINK